MTFDDAVLAATLDVPLGEVAQANIDKLRLRWPDGFVREDATTHSDEGPRGDAHGE